MVAKERKSSHLLEISDKRQKVLPMFNSPIVNFGEWVDAGHLLTTNGLIRLISLTPDDDCDTDLPCALVLNRSDGEPCTEHPNAIDHCGMEEWQWPNVGTVRTVQI
jgi:hypothetical protein